MASLDGHPIVEFGKQERKEFNSDDHFTKNTKYFSLGTLNAKSGLYV
jgi:hypothetical protein